MTGGYAAILASGQGLRLRPITLAIPKGLLPLAGGTPLLYLVNRLRAAGFLHIAVVRSRHPAWQHFPLPPLAVSFLTQEPPFTLARGLATLLPWAPLDQPVLLLHGDNLLHADLGLLHQAMEQAPIGWATVGGEAREIAAVYWLPYRALALAAQHPALDSLAQLRDLWRQYGLEPVQVTLPGRRFNINTRIDYLQAHHYVLDHWADFRDLAGWPGTWDAHTHTWVSHYAQVEASRLAYTVVAPHAQVRYSQLTNCIVAPHTTVHRVHGQDRVFFVSPREFAAWTEGLHPGPA